MRARWGSDAVFYLAVVAVVCFRGACGFIPRAGSEKAAPIQGAGPSAAATSLQRSCEAARWPYSHKYRASEASGVSQRLFMNSGGRDEGTTTPSRSIPMNMGTSTAPMLCGRSERFTVKDIMVEQGSHFGGLLARTIYKAELCDLANTFLVSSRITHVTNGPVPRSMLSSILLIEDITEGGLERVQEEDPSAIIEIIERSLRWFLDSGGRIGRLSVAVPSNMAGVEATLASLGYSESPLFTDEYSSLHAAVVPPSHKAFGCDADKLLLFLTEKAASTEISKKSPVYQTQLQNLIGRLLHDVGRPQESVDYYTRALQLDSKGACIFRNLGSAYQAVGQAQMAFASFQQAVQLAPDDASVYLKLAFFYEDFAKMDWDDAADHAERCYRYYLDNVDPEDTSVLTRLGNLLVREHKSVEAVVVYERVLALDGSLHNVWFNKAHAHIKIGDNSAAIASLRKTLELEPNIAAARHMLRALSEEEADEATTVDEEYVRGLFNDYGNEYDNHVKKLLYSAPRVIRQELAKVYQGRFNIPEDEVNNVPMSPPGEGPGCTVVVPTIKINNTLDILDLGCGTGLAGAWLKDYAHSIVGVDLSENMVDVARKKMIYKELNIMSASSFLQSCAADFDLVVAADMLSYVGELGELFKGVGKVMRRGAHFAFTVEAVSDEQTGKGAIDGNFEASVERGQHRGYKLLRNGRFGYSKSYVDKVLGGLGQVDVLVSRQFSPRMDAGEPVPGYLYVITKK